MPGPVELLTLHALRLRSLCAVEAVAARFDLDPVEVDDVLRRAEADGRVRHRSGRLSGWSLTGDGRRHAEGLLHDELDRTGARPAVAAAYVSFLALNGEVLSVCTDWQVVGGPDGPVVNDHTDAGRDAEVLARLGVVEAAAAPVAAALAAALDRFAGYGDRLAHARARVAAGEHDWLTRPTIDSFHTVWFELHEDLLATLGRSRSDERAAATTAAAEEYA